MLLKECRSLDAEMTHALHRELAQLVAERAARGQGDPRSLATFHRAPVSDRERLYLRRLLSYFWRGPLAGIYRQTFKLEPILLLDLSKFRAQQPDITESYVPWHLDANFYGFDIPMMTAWVPFTDAGRDAPGLEFCVPSRPLADDAIRQFWEALPRHAVRGRTLADDQVEALVGPAPRRFAPALGVGTCVVFDQHVLHRTQILAGATKRRLALEFRIAAADRPPKGWLTKETSQQLAARLDRRTGEVSIQSLEAVFTE